MAPNRTTEFKYETYKRLTLLTKNRFRNIKTAVDELSKSEAITKLDINTLSGYLTEIERKKADFESNFQKTLELNEELPLETLSEDQDFINNEYLYLTSLITTLLPSVNAETNLSEHNDSSISQAVKSPLKLPKLNLPTFSGNLETWISFINLYNATVHNNPDIDPVLKFQYLLSVLRGEALNIVKSLNLTAENYVIAYRLLTDRYQNDRRLKSFHLNNLLDLPSVTASRPQLIRQFINSFNENTQALSALECSVTGVNPVLSAMLMRKMDVELRKRFETFRGSNNNNRNDFPEVQDIISFLTKECVHNEDALLTQHKAANDHTPFVNHSKQGTNHKSGFTKRDITMLATHSSDSIKPPQNSKSCFFCNLTTHTIYHCPDFKSKSPKERYDIVKQARHCISCLGNHSFKQCQSTKRCLTCKKPHHTMLHFGDSTVNPPSHDNHMVTKTTSFHNQSSPIKDKGLATSASVSLASNKSLPSTNHTVLLGTLLIRLQTAEGHSHVFRALLDSGSMCDLISERAANLLHAHRHKSTIQLTGINQTTTHHRGQIVASISTPSGQLIAPHQQLLILDKITVDIPRQQLAPEVIQKAQSFHLADPSFHIPGHIDMVIGSSLFPQLLTQDQHSLGADMPYVVGTHFGYVVMGNAPCDTKSKPINEVSSTTAISCHVSSDSDLHEDLQRFWRQEEPPIASRKSHEENICDQHFADTHERDSSGRYIVRLPLKESKTALGNSMPAAKARLNAMEQKFDRDDRFSNLYHNFMSEYLDLNHMSPRENIDFTQPHYFLPHHGIIRESSSTTKLRTVFDASCPSSSGKSLNDISFVGKKLQSNICDILLQFRRHNVVFCCDIKQMYRQILIHPDDRDLQLILWREHTSQPIQIFQLNTVTYGVNSSPYLAIRTLHQLANDEGNRFPEAAYVLKNHTYVDDIITGADTPSEANQLKHQLLSLLKCGGFELRKWISNSAELLSDLPENHLEIPKFLNDPTIPHFKVLGLQWSPTTDVFSYNTQFPSPSKLTKRIILSIIATLYDPCGFLSPFLLLTKSFMQLMWTNLCHWDEILPFELSDKWKVIADDTKYLKDIQVPRSFHFTATDVIQLHGFCDASESGYAAVIYFHIESQSHAVTTSQVMAKSKVAPLKRVTLPRLELCAAHLLAKLVAYCRNVFTNLIPTANTYLWCDSTIALTWLQTPSYKLKTYVANRVAQTQELIPNDCWNHISSDQNPADCASRGLLPSQLINHNMWWTGPEWLKLPSCDWPKTSFSPVILDPSLEIKSNPLPVLLITSIDEDVLLNRYSSWMKLQRITALVLRFIHNCRSSSRRTGFLTTNELTSARLKIFWCVQQVSFSECITSLKKNQECSKPLIRLQPFLDENGLIRVGGRLKLAPLKYDVKHPILLPKHHHVTHILINHCHVAHLHAGPQLTQSLLSQTVWILSARSVIRSQIHKCLCCFKHKPTNNAPLMGDLPLPRVTPSKPFLSAGVDYGGPFTIKILNSRSTKHVKAYICIFVCMVTKAVHIEVSHDLSTESFIACLTRFISRRGQCSHIYSDCGTNMVGASNEMKRIIKALKSDSQESIHRFACEHHIQFHFNPPAAPHHGGLWENAIKQAKHHLLRTIGSTVLTLPEFITLTTKVEAMLNSRPLTPLSNDPADLDALTPNHFLVGGPTVPLPEEDFTNIPLNRLSHWQQVQQMSQHIWRRWSVEYLHTLQQRNKWNKHHGSLKVGDLVLMDTPSPPFKWPLARVIKVYPGSDNIVRVAEVKTASGVFKRPVVKLFPLPNMTS